ncbi:MAG: DNA-3-methyladenine glycosylase [Bacteroidales bacterium]
MNRVNKDLLTRDVLEIAPAMLGMHLKRVDSRGNARSYTVTETEAYRGEEDLACHVSRGRTDRTEIMYHEGGVLYVYLVYGIHWMLNIVTGMSGEPQAVLVRAVQGISGPGRLTKALGIDRSFNAEDITLSPRIWLENTGVTIPYETTPRVGIDYAGPLWKAKPWRFVATAPQAL